MGRSPGGPTAMPTSAMEGPADLLPLCKSYNIHHCVGQNFQNPTQWGGQKNEICLKVPAKLRCTPVVLYKQIENNAATTRTVRIPWKCQLEAGHLEATSCFKMMPIIFVAQYVINSNFYIASLLLLFYFSGFCFSFPIQRHHWSEAKGLCMGLHHVLPLHPLAPRKEWLLGDENSLDIGGGGEREKRNHAHPAPPGAEVLSIYTWRCLVHNSKLVNYILLKHINVNILLFTVCAFLYYTLYSKGYTSRRTNSHKVLSWRILHIM